MGKRRRLPYLCRNHGPPDSGDLASAEDLPHSFHSTAAHAQEAIVQETGGIGITDDELNLFAHLGTGMAARHLEDAVLSRKIAHAQFGMIDGQGGMVTGGHGFEPGIDHHMPRMATGHGGENRESRLQVVDKEGIPVAGIHKNTATRLNFGDAGVGRGQIVAARAPGADNGNGDPGAFEQVATAHEVIQGLVTGRLLGLGRRDVEHVAFPSHEALEGQAGGLEDLAGQFQARPARLDTGAVHPDIDIDQYRYAGALGACRLGRQID